MSKEGEKEKWEGEREGGKEREREEREEEGGRVNV